MRAFAGQRAAGVTPEAMRAHGGPLLAIAAQGGRVWTSGSDRHAATLREWSAQGHLSSSVLLGAFGEALRLAYKLGTPNKVQFMPSIPLISVVFL